MKTLRKYLTKSFLPLIILLIILSSCKKSSNQNGNEINPNSKALEIQKRKDLEQTVAKTLTTIYEAKPEVKKELRDVCLKQTHGDYYIRLSEIVEEPNIRRLMSTGQAESMLSIAKQLKSLDGGRESILFIPSVETSDPSSSIATVGSNAVAKSGTDNPKVNQVYNPTPVPTGPIYVFGEDGGVNNTLFPGYFMNYSTGGLEYYGMISESFAWSNEVWVIGIEEESSYNPNDGGDYLAVSNKAKTMSQRNPTRVEYGGRINVTDISQIESWVRGKLELKYFINTSMGGTLIKERAFAPVSRSDVKNKWYEFNDRIGNWDPAIWGQIQYERWIEEDGGSSTTISTPITPVAGGPTYTISTTYKDDDDDCGLAAVNYNDTFYGEVPLQPQYWTVYNISYMNFQRYSQYQQ